MLIHRTLFFTDEELNNLQGSTLVPNTIRRKQSAALYHNVITKWILADKEKEDSIWKGDIFTENDWFWALSMLWSRAFAVKVNDTPMGSLVPFADMMNAHDPYTDELRVKALLQSKYS